MKPGSYALITGASLGIGRAISFELAGMDYHLILVALPGKDLDELAEIIQNEYPVDVLTLGIDLTLDNAVEKIFEFVHSRDIKVSILINNAGIGTHGLFYKSDRNKNQYIIKLNNMSLVCLTRNFIEMLMEQPRAYIMNVSSMEATLPLPYKSVYTATKAFIYSFSLALHEELKGTGISISVLCPGPVLTNEEGRKRAEAMGKRSQILMKMPEYVAKKAVNGMFGNKLVIIPGVIPWLIVEIMKLFPTKLRMKILEKIFRAYRNS